MIFVGIDWSEGHQLVEVQAESGKLLKGLRVDADVAGLTRLQEVISEHAEDASQVVVGIEATQGLLVNALIGSGYRVYSINPLSAARAREGESPAGSKSDVVDAHVLADLVRTRRPQLRPLAGDSELAQVVQVRARSHVRAIRLQRRLRNELRSTLGKYFAAALPLLGEEPEDLRDALAVLSLATTPAQARRLSLDQLRTSLAQHGRQRNINARAIRIRELLRLEQLELKLPRLVKAYSDEVGYLVRTLLQVRAEIRELEQQLAQDLEEHTDAEIILSLPGLGLVLGARVLGESGDDPTRFAHARARKNYAGNAPVTKSSGKYRSVSRRLARNRWLADASFLWANSAINASPGARAYYDRQRARGNSHNGPPGPWPTASSGSSTAAFASAVAMSSQSPGRVRRRPRLDS